MWQKVTSMSVIPFEQNLFFGYSGDNEPARYKGEINMGATFAKTPHTGMIFFSGMIWT